MGKETVVMYVDIDLHRRSSHVAAFDEEGLEVLSRRVTNDPEALRAIFAELVGEARWCWVRWLAVVSTDLFGRGGARVSVRSARGLNQPVGPPVGARAKAEFARAAAFSRRRISPSRRP